MNINRNNYEEYFLLYADNELSAAEKNMVEMFIQENPDIEEEFIILQQSIIKPDYTIEYQNKNSLLREDTFINTNNYEEKFLLYADNELSLTEIEETETFALSDPSLQNEFNLLQQVKFVPDTSTFFPDKSSLYKSENDNKIIPFRWKALAAAVLLGLGLWTGIIYLQPNKTKPVMVINSVPKKKIETNSPVLPKEEKGIVSTEKDKITTVKKDVEKVLVAVVKKQNQPPQNVSVKLIEPINKQKKNEVVAINEQPKNNIIEPAKDPQKSNSEAIIKVTPAITSSQSNNAQTASYITDNELKSENYVFYNVTKEEFEKSKIGVLFKRVKRLVERKNPLREKSFKVSSVAETPGN